MNHKKFFLYSISLLLFLIFAYHSCVVIKNIQEKRKNIKISSGIFNENANKLELQTKLHEMLNGYPMEKMIPYILEKDPKVAAFIVSIGKKESNWGKRKPVLNGEDCFNYWGYRAQRERMGSGGHTCFDNPKDAIDTVAKRIEYLVYETGKDTPKKMVYWKCGNSCAGHSSLGVQKWINDVSLYFEKFISK